MKPRERVLKAFRKMEGNPDRVPVQFDLCRQHLEYFGKKLGISVTYTENLYEDVTYRISGNEIRLALGSDVVVTGAGPASDFVRKVEPDGTWYNEYGMRMKQGTIYVEIAEYPLADAETSAQIEEYKFPDPTAPGRYDDAEKLIEKYRDDYLIIGDIEVTVFSLGQQLVGMEKLMIDMAMGEDYVETLFKKCADFQQEIGLELIRRGVDAIWFGDDFGSQTGLLFSPDMFRNMLKPFYSDMIKAFKAANPDIIPILHCDGAVRDFLDDIIDMGFEAFNPLQPGVPGHGPAEIKKEFGDRLAFWGAIDQQDLLPKGTDKELEDDIREKISILGEDRGFMIAPAHIIQADVIPERIIKFIELSKKYGDYS